MVERADWSFESEQQGGRHVTSGELVPLPQRERAPVERADWNYDANGEQAAQVDFAGVGPQAATDIQLRNPESGQFVSTPNLDAELVRDMTIAPDGFEANLHHLRTAANVLMDSDPLIAAVGRDAFVAHFDTLSPSIQSKALRALWQRPDLPLAGLLDTVEAKLTLAEQSEAERWLRQLRQ